MLLGRDGGMLVGEVGMGRAYLVDEVDADKGDGSGIVKGRSYLVQEDEEL